MGRPRKLRKFDNEEEVSKSNENIEDLKQLEETTSSSGSSKAPSLGDSPLLRDSVIEKDYASTTAATNPTGTAAEPQRQQAQPPPPQSKPKIEGTEFHEPVYAIPEDDVPSPQYKQPEMATEYPEGNTDIDTSNDTVEIPQQVSNESAKSLADTIASTYRDVIPELIFWKTSINEKEVKKLVDTGQLFDQAYQDVKEHNKSTFDKLKKRASEDARMLKKPLARLFEVKNVKASPMAELGIVLAAIVILNFVMIKEISRGNKDINEKLDMAAQRTKVDRERQNNIVNNMNKVENPDGSSVQEI